jgi:N-acetyl-anhydromuramyl-L-alanine amidase AmpD
MKRGAGIALAGGAALALLALTKRAKAGGVAMPVQEVLWIPSPNYTPATRIPPQVRAVVIHTMQAPKTATAAVDMARNWAALPSSKVSAHYGVDSDHVVQMVQEHDIAWHVRSANPFTIGVEHAGSAAASPLDWTDAYNVAMLARSARLVHGICIRWDIPFMWLDAAALKAGGRGITGHKECTDAFEGGVGHGDPGAGFPRLRYVDLVQRGG